MGFLFRQFFKLIAMAVTITSTVDPIYFTRNPIEVELHTDETWASTLRIICEVKVELVYDSSTYVLIATHSSTPDSATNKSKFRLDKILDSAFYEALEFPDYNGTIPNTAIDGGYSDNHIKRVTIRFADNGGDPFATYDFLVIHGGMSFQKFYEYDWLNQYAVHKRFFTWLGAKKTIPTLYEYVTWLCPVAEIYKLRVVVNTDQGTTFADRSGFTGVANRIYRFHSGFTQLGVEAIALAAFPGDPPPVIRSYDVQVIGITRSSEIFIYNMDFRHYMNLRKISFINSPGGTDSMYFSGEEIIRPEYTRTTFSRQLLAGYETKVGLRRQNRPFENYGFRVNTGLKTRTEMDSIRELLLSEYIVLDTGTRFLPLECTVKGGDLLSEKNNLNSFVLEFRYAFENISYTPESV